jgi:hypothetical protein
VSISAFFAIALVTFDSEPPRICPSIHAPAPESGFEARLPIISIIPPSCFATAEFIAAAPSLVSAFLESHHISIGSALVIAD